MAKRILLVVREGAHAARVSAAVSAGRLARESGGAVRMMYVSPLPPARMDRHDRMVANIDQEMMRIDGEGEDCLARLAAEIADARRLVDFGPSCRPPSAVQCPAGIETGRPCERRCRSRKGLTMTTTASTEALIANLDKVAHEVLEYFAGPGRVSGARVDRWQARDILMHFIYFHDATAWGIQSAALGGPPWPVPADSDTVNEACRRLHEHESFDELLTQLRQAHARLLGAARRAPDLDKPCLQRSTGEVLSGRQRLELLARHWAEHMSELQAAGAR